MLYELILINEIEQRAKIIFWSVGEFVVLQLKAQAQAQKRQPFKTMRKGHR